MLDAVVDYLPSPLDLPPTAGHEPARARTSSERKADDDEPFAALAFKIMTDPFVGKLTYLRVYSGTLAQGRRRSSTRPRTSKERIGRILQMHANHREDKDAIYAGDIVAVVGLKHDHDRRHPVRPAAPDRARGARRSPSRSSTSPSSPRPRPTRTSCRKALCTRSSEEDPTFRVRTDEETGQTVISGMGELHLEVLVDRMLREFSVDANVGKPQVAYRETIRKTVDKVEERYVRQTGGRGQYGHVVHRPRADRPGRRLRVRRQDHRRRHPEGVHPVGRRRHPGGPDRPACWPATRSSTSG